MAVASTTLETAREIVSLLVNRSPGSEVAAGTDSLKRIDYAIQAAGSEFVRRTRCTLKKNDSLTLTADSEDFSTASVTDFHPSRLTNIEVKHPTTSTIYPARLVNYDHVRNRRLNGVERGPWYPYASSADQVGVPSFFAWRDETNAIVAPLPGVAWEVLLTYWAPFTSWTNGTATPASVTFNIPDDMLDGVLNHGVRAYFNAAEDGASAGYDRSMFEKHIRECRGLYATTREVIPSREDYR